MKSWIGRGAAALCVITPFAIARAQDAPPSDEDISNEIIVTAQKRSTSLQDVPFSIAAVTAEDIASSGVNSLAELSRNVPGLYITDLGPGQSQVAIRGISAGQVVRDQAGVKESVGIYLDESAISIALFTPDLELYDLDRVEVLRGPQGTLYGAGNDSGTLRYITAQPDIGDFGGSLDLTANAGTDSEMGGASRAKVNVPIGENAAMRLVAYRSELAGFIDSYYPGREVREDVNSGSRTGGRLRFSLRAQRKRHHHAARGFPEAGDGRVSAHRRVQHPRQHADHHRAAGGCRGPRPGHAVAGRAHRRLPAVRCEDGLHAE